MMDEQPTEVTATLHHRLDIDAMYQEAVNSPNGTISQADWDAICSAVRFRNELRDVLMRADRALNLFPFELDKRGMTMVADNMVFSVHCDVLDMENTVT